MAPEGLVEVRVSWPGHPRYLKKKKGRMLCFCFECKYNFGTCDYSITKFN